MKHLTLQNKDIILKIDPSGGAYTDFRFKDQQVNPLDWELNDPALPPFKGHFLCFDRWGPPSEEEAKNGFKHHGEVNEQQWKIVGKTTDKDEVLESTMSCTLPMGGLQLTRNVKLSATHPVVKVTEHIKNLNKYGRMFNIVQHVTLAPPFLDRSTLFDNNTEKGFEDKEDGSLNQEKPVIRWPEAIHKKKQIRLRQFQDKWPRVSSFVFNKNEKYGWVTASNPDKNMLLGYIWKTNEYPWVNFWRSMENNEPQAYGIEFGTTGLHEPFPVIAKKGEIFGQKIYDFIDANEVIEKSFIAFLAKIPTDYRGVSQIHVNHAELTIREHNSSNRVIKYNI